MSSTPSTRDMLVLGLVDIVKNDFAVVGAADALRGCCKLAQEHENLDASSEARRVRVDLSRRAGRHDAVRTGRRRRECWEVGCER